MTDAARPSVLVADDDADILALLSFQLERDGYRVVVAADGGHALALARSERPALCILDVRMPGLTGYDVVRALRSDGATARIPVILLTARVQERDVAEGLAAGADDYVSKPFSPQELSGRVATLLGATQRERR